MKKTLLSVLKVAVSLGLLVVALRMVDAGAMWRLFDDAEPRNLGIAAALLIAAGFSGAGAWLCILHSRLPRLTYRETAAAHWIGMFFNSFLPSNVGGDIVRGYRIAQGSGQRGFVIVSLLADRVLGLLLLVLIGGIVLVASRGKTGTTAACVGTLVALLMSTPAVAKRILQVIPPTGQERVNGKIAKLLQTLRPLVEIAISPRRFVPLLLLSGATQALRIWQNVFVIRALGLDVPEIAVWGIIPIFGIVSSLPLTIGGLGIRECAAQALAKPTGLNGTHLIVLSLAGHILVILTNTLGIIPFLRPTPPPVRVSPNDSGSERL